MFRPVRRANKGGAIPTLDAFVRGLAPAVSASEAFDGFSYLLLGESKAARRRGGSHPLTSHWPWRSSCFNLWGHYYRMTKNAENPRFHWLTAVPRFSTQNLANLAL